jgi:predicted TIM-barrel fold metal-dependent hydrolase
LADVHTHFLPERMQRRVWAHFDEAGPLIGRPWPILYKEPDADRVARLNRWGVRMFSALAYAHRPQMAADLNDWTLDFAARTPGCLPSATFFPEPGNVAYVRDALDRGARIVKLHLQVGGFDPRTPELDAVWGLLAESGTPVVVHAGSGPVATTFTGPGPIGEVLARHPRLAMITAHLGAPEYDGFLALAERYERVTLDTTMALTDFFEQIAPFPPALLGRLRDLGLAGKVLLGSDFPNIPYPYGHQLFALRRAGLGDDWLRAVCWENAYRMFGD